MATHDEMPVKLNNDEVDSNDQFQGSRAASRDALTLRDDPIINADADVSTTQEMTSKVASKSASHPTSDTLVVDWEGGEQGNDPENPKK